MIDSSSSPPVSIRNEAVSYALLGVVGEGTFSVVYRAVARPTNTICAIKRLKKVEQAAARIRDEVGCLMALRGCRYVINILDCVRHPDGHIDIIMP